MTDSDEFLRQFRHDVRSPLNVVIGFAAVLEGELDGDQADSARMIREAGEQILGLVDGNSAPATPSPGPSEPVSADRAVRRVVLVEDHPSNVRLVERIFAHRPHLELVSFETGEAALDAVFDMMPMPELVLLDRHLPGISGFEVLSALTERHPGLPVVMVTADATAAVHDEATSLGAAAVVTKPFAVGDVLAMVDRYASASAMPGSNL